MLEQTIAPVQMPDPEVTPRQLINSPDQYQQIAKRTDPVNHEVFELGLNNIIEAGRLRRGQQSDEPLNLGSKSLEAVAPELEVMQLASESDDASSKLMGKAAEADLERIAALLDEPAAKHPE